MIVQDLLKTLLAVLTVIVVIIVSRQFIRILAEAIEGQVSSETLLTILGLKTIIASVEFLPVALFMAILMVLGRMYRDQEMAAISSAGGGSGTIYRAVFLLVFPLSVLAVGLSLYAAPWAQARIDSFMQKDEESSDLRGIAAGKFSEYSQGDLVFYVEKISADKKMHKVFVQNRQPGNVGIINAEAAQLKDLPDGRYIIFENGERVQGQPGTLNYVIEQFAEYAVRIETKVPVAAKFNRQALSLDILWGSGVAHNTAELQRRFSIPLGALLLSFIAVPLAHPLGALLLSFIAVPLAQISPRGGVYGNMLMGFLIYFSYGNLLRVSQSWVTNETIPAWLGGSGVNVLLLLIGCFLVARLYGWQWLIMKVRRKVS
ncbi:MAG: LPS export ABC transporter permease LptF [Methylococcaceae bacterium]|nr:LPS export ABC transporter permease LptF [Methylococcaceae bacterium]